MNTSPGIYFYLPEKFWPIDLPDSMTKMWNGFSIGIYAWTIQTYLYLKQANFPCQLVSQIPDEGIIFFHRNALGAHPKGLRPNPRQLLICLKAEERPAPFAQLHIVQNPTEVKFLPGSYYIPHWTQPGLQQRESSRGDRFEVVSFLGHQNSLAKEFTENKWLQDLANIGLKWHSVVHTNPWYDYQSLNNQWANYRHIDVVIAIRSFQNNDRYPQKPATKLFNAWLAGVPAILGQESAYTWEGRVNENYLEAQTYDQVLEHLVALRDDPSLRDRLVANGLEQSQRIQPLATLQHWQQFIQTIAIPAFGEWVTQNSWQRFQVNLGNYCYRKGKRLFQRILKSGK
jgi:hypothetical protein